jgi:hypothetical protein
MSGRDDILELQKEVLLARSSLCRLRIHRDVLQVREGLTLSRAGTALAGSAPMREIALGLAATGFGGGRVAHFIALAGRAVVIARLALALYRAARPAPAPRP